MTAKDQAFVSALTSCLERGAMVLRAMAQAQLRFADDRQPTARAIAILRAITDKVTDQERPSRALESLASRRRRTDIPDAEYDACLALLDDIESLRRTFYDDPSITETIAAVAMARPGFASAVALKLDVLLE